MINDPVIKWFTTAVVASVFVASVLFAYVMLTDDTVADDASKALMYAAVFAAVIIILNVTLLAVGIWASRKARALGMMKKCQSCGAVIDRYATNCSECGTIQTDEGTYLEPKAPDGHGKVRPKKK